VPAGAVLLSRPGYGESSGSGFSAIALLPAHPVDPLANLLLGAIMQAGMVVARADDPEAAKRAMAESSARLVSSL